MIETRKQAADRLPSRDGAGFLFRRNGKLLRQVSKPFSEQYEQLRSRGIYADLIERGLLLPHRELEAEFPASPDSHCLLEPAPVSVLSRPLHWCFAQLRDAARVTLAIERFALERGATLRDATAWNIQFVDYRPVLIDTLSLGIREANEPWMAYRQFCEQFLAPLAMSSRIHPMVGRALRQTPDGGVDLTVAAQTLGIRSWRSLTELLNLHWHARHTNLHPPGIGPIHNQGLSTRRLLGLVNALEDYVVSLPLPCYDRFWSRYAEVAPYSTHDAALKETTVLQMVGSSGAHRVLELGANTASLSLAVADAYPDVEVIAVDRDEASVSVAYETIRRRRTPNAYAFLSELSSEIGATVDQPLKLGTEHLSGDLVVAYALMHHLVIEHGISIQALGAFLATITNRTLLFEYVPSSDPSAQVLRDRRGPYAAQYSRDEVIASLDRFFEMHDEIPVGNAGRALLIGTRRV